VVGGEVAVRDPEIPLQLDGHRQVIGPSGSESRGARSQAAFNSRVMSSQIQWASALVWR